MKLGEKIRKIRDLKGLSQENMAHALRLSVSAYGKLERNETDISYSKLEEVANILQISPVDIIRFDEAAVFVNNFDNKAENNKGNFIFNQHNVELAEKAHHETISAKDQTIALLKQELEKKDVLIERLLNNK